MTKSIAFLKSQINKSGGLEKYTLRLAESFAKAGHKVVLLTTDVEEQMNSTSVEIVSLGKRSRLSFWHLLQFDKRCQAYLQEHPQDVVFGMDRNFCLQTHYRAGNGCHAAYLQRRSHYESWFKAQSFRFNPLHQLLLRMEKKTFEHPKLQKLFVNSEMVLQEILNHYPEVDREKLAVVHNGVEWNELQKPFEDGLLLRPKILKQLGLNPDAFQFVFVGNEYERKGLFLLLEALALLSGEKWQLSVLGKERHPERFKQRAKALGLEDRVRFFGPVKEVKVYYSAADALVVSSLYDPFANVTVEALAMGLYVISSSANGGSEVLTPETGMVFSDLKDPQELSRCLKQALNQRKTKESATRIRQAVAHLDFSNQINKVLALTV